MQVQTALDIASCAMAWVLQTDSKPNRLPMVTGWALLFSYVAAGPFSLRRFCVVRMWPPSLFAEKVSES